MIYFYYGSDSDKARARARAVLSVMKKKKPEAEYFRVVADRWNQAEFENFLAGQGLFERKFIVFADGVFENEQAKCWLIEKMKELGVSDNAFVFLEVGIDSDSLKKIKASAREVVEFGDTAKGKEKGYLGKKGKEDFKVFALSDALGRRDKKETWAVFSEAIWRGLPAEELSGILFWQIKAMIIASESPNALLACQHAFVFGKSKRYASNFSSEELTRMSEELVGLYHDSRRGFFDLSTALERFILKI